MKSSIFPSLGGEGREGEKEGLLSTDYLNFKYLKKGLLLN